ncbi:hypothetical protein PTKIN_Ptkin07bG0264200 [Pterospermum kingtungense]
MVDATGGAIKDDDSATDVKFIDASPVHYLSGPIRVVDKDGIPAMPGDLLAVEICNLGPLSGDEWGYTATFDRENGGDIYKREVLNGKRLPRRRQGQCQEEKMGEIVTSKTLVEVPKYTLYPVFVEGANLSTGDMHFSEGDGEVSFCGAIEMSGFLELKCEIIRGGMKEYLTPMGPTPLHVNPIFEIGPVEPRFSEWLVFEGISVDECGRQHYLDATVAYKRAVLNAIDYLSKFGFSKEQVYLLLSCCPCEGRISGIVDSPNAVATLAIPTAIFDQDIRPKTGKVPIGPRLVTKPDVLRCTYDGNLPTTKNPSCLDVTFD